MKTNTSPLKDVYMDELEYLKDLGVPNPREEAIKRTQNAISEHIIELIDVTNSSALNSEQIAKGILDGITRSHRYLQNEFWMAMTKVIENYGNLPSEYQDARNAYAVKDCNVMSDALNKARG